MTFSLQLVLLLFALVGYAGSGASLAVLRQRRVTDGEYDVGMAGIAGMLFVFGALCTMVGVGPVGVLAFGGVVLWASYVIVAQRLGVFSVEVASSAPPVEEEPTEKHGPRRGL
jgi:threonine/homoserine efflux transporter RhtA